MSASIATYSFASSSPHAPDLGGARRSIAAAIAVVMLIVGLSGWAQIDARDAQVAAMQQSN